MSDDTFRQCTSLLGSHLDGKVGQSVTGHERMQVGTNLVHRALLCEGGVRRWVTSGTG